jgi:hypothetical protein
MSHQIATLSQFPSGYPFANGKWIDPSPAPAPKVPFVAALSPDNVCLTEQSLAHRNESAGGCITVKSGDTLSQLLLERGYSLKEMLQKDENGLTLLDRTAAANSLKNPNLIFPGQELNLPCKEDLSMEQSPQGEPALQDTAAQPSREGVVVFDDFGDGVIDEQDLENSRQTHKAFAGDGDFDGDGKVDWVEHLRANSLRHRMEAWDSNQNGRLDGAELNAVGARFWTDNGDGVVSDEELTAIDPKLQLTASGGPIKADHEDGVTLVW